MRRSSRLVRLAFDRSFATASEEERVAAAALIADNLRMGHVTASRFFLGEVTPREEEAFLAQTFAAYARSDAPNAIPEDLASAGTPLPVDPHLARPCAVCGELMDCRRSTKRYCTDHCKMALYNAERRAGVRPYGRRGR